MDDDVDFAAAARSSADLSRRVEHRRRLAALRALAKRGTKMIGIVRRGDHGLAVSIEDEVPQRHSISAPDMLTAPS